MADITNLLGSRRPLNENPVGGSRSNGKHGFFKANPLGVGPVIKIDGQDGTIDMGGHGADGIIVLRDKHGVVTVIIDGTRGGLFQSGDLEVQGTATVNELTVTGTMRIEGLAVDGTITTTNLTVNDRAQINHLQVGESAQINSLELQQLNVSAMTQTLDLEVDSRAQMGKLDVLAKTKTAELEITGRTWAEDIIVANSNGEQMIQIDSEAGDIRFLNADCAEDFDIVETEAIEPGTVMVLEQEGRLRPSLEAYDRKVVGVISGAGGLKPGIVLDQQPDEGSKRVPITLMGKVFCRVDADYSPVEIGDLLTTSPTRGHAMKVTDPVKAFGAVIGKALRSLDAGKGLIPVLVALQ